VFPLLLGSAELEEEAVVTTFSVQWFGFFAITGAAFEIVRYYDELGFDAILN